MDRGTPLLENPNALHIYDFIRRDRGRLATLCGCKQPHRYVHANGARSAGTSDRLAQG